MSDIPPTPSNVFAGPGYGESSRPPGPPSGGDFDARLRGVEADTREIKAILYRLEPILMRVDGSTRKIEVEALPKLQADLAETKGRVAQLPTSLSVLAYVGSVFGLAIAVVGITIVLMRSFGH